MNASVSVIVPCFRSADTIGRALQSIDEQTIRPREVILVDDASGDETLGVLLKKKSEYEPEWIKVLVLATNSGPAAAATSAGKTHRQTL